MSLFPPSVEYAIYNVPRGKASKIFVVDFVNGSDSGPGTQWSAPLKTLEAAYAKTVDLRNDIILLISASTAYLSTAAIAWANNYTHLIGLSAPSLMEPRTIVKSPVALASTPFITWSGSGCVVKNISFWHESSNVASLVNFYLTGGRNYFESCQFAGGCGANGVTGARSLKIGGASGGNSFKNCMIGQDFVNSPNGVAALEFVLGANHNIFDDCVFNGATDGTTFAHVTVAAAAGLGKLNLFRRCLFTNTGAGVQASIFVLTDAATAGTLITVTGSWKYGATDWNHDNHGVVGDFDIAANHTGVNSGSTLIVTSS